MSNLKISQLTTYIGSASGSYLIVNNPAETGTYKITRENLLSNYTASKAISSSYATFASSSHMLDGHPSSQYPRLNVLNTFTQDIQVIVSGTHNAGTYEGDTLFLLDLADGSEIGFSNHLEDFISGSNRAGIYVSSGSGLLPNRYRTVIDITNGPNFTNGGDLRIHMPTQITGSITISGSTTITGHQIINNSNIRLSEGASVVWTGSLVLNDWNYAPNLSANTTGFSLSPQGVFASSLNKVFINMSGSLGVGKIPTASLDVSGSANMSNGITITGSVLSNVTALSISSNTASLNLTSGSFYTLQLVSGSNTYINPSNISAGQTVSLLVSTTGSATVSFPSTVKQPSGSSYVPTTTTGKDVLTFISFDTTNLYLANVKNLI